MLRRKPTRIELKLEDMEEYESMKKEMKQENSAKKGAPGNGQDSSSAKKDIHERIGYNPSGPSSPTPPPRLPIH